LIFDRRSDRTWYFKMAKMGTEIFVNRHQCSTPVNLLGSKTLNESERFIDEMYIKNVVNDGKKDLGMQTQIINILIDQVNFLKEELRTKNSIISSLINAQQIKTHSCVKINNKMCENEKIKSFPGDFVMDQPSLAPEIVNTDTPNVSINDNNTTMMESKLNFDEQLVDVRRKKHEHFIKSRKNNADENSVKETTHKWKKGTVLIIGDSMISGLDEKRLSAQGMIKVRTFPGSKVEDLMDYVKPLFKKDPSKILIHVGTNNSTNETSREIIDKLLILKNHIKLSLPKCTVLMSNIIDRFDNAKAAITIKNFNQHLNELSVEIVENSNIGRDCLGKKGLHLNRKGSGKLAINILNKLRSCRHE